MSWSKGYETNKLAGKNGQACPNFPGRLRANMGPSGASHVVHHRLKDCKFRIPQYIGVECSTCSAGCGSGAGSKNILEPVMGTSWASLAYLGSLWAILGVAMEPACGRKSGCKRRLVCLNYLGLFRANMGAHVLRGAVHVLLGASRGTGSNILKSRSLSSQLAVSRIRNLQNA